MLSLVDTDDNSDFRIYLEDGHIKFQDTTNNNRTFLVANSGGDCNIGVSGETTACMGDFVVNGNTTLANALEVGSSASTSSAAALSIGSASGTQGVLFPGGTQSQLNTVAIGGPGGLVMYNQSTASLAVLNSSNTAFYDIVTRKNSVLARLEVWSDSVVKTTGITHTPTAAWEDLFATYPAALSYPQITIPNAPVGDAVEVRGTLTEDHVSTGYANMSSVFQYVIREGNSSGTDIGSAAVSVVAGGDNNIENAQGTYFTRVRLSPPQGTSSSACATRPRTPSHGHSSHVRMGQIPRCSCG